MEKTAGEKAAQRISSTLPTLQYPLLLSLRGVELHTTSHRSTPSQRHIFIGALQVSLRAAVLEVISSTSRKTRERLETKAHAPEQVSDGSASCSGTGGGTGEIPVRGVCSCDDEQKATGDICRLPASRVGISRVRQVLPGHKGGTVIGSTCRRFSYSTMWERCFLIGGVSIFGGSAIHDPTLLIHDPTLALPVLCVSTSLRPQEASKVSHGYFVSTPATCTREKEIRLGAPVVFRV